MSKPLSGLSSLRPMPSPSELGEQLYRNAATAPKLPPGHPQAPVGPVWTRPPDKPAHHPNVDARGNPV